ncbi:hypothetical protein IFU04_22330 [Pseudomonas syringae]|nr:hypothetical protein [Pseudomonas syringae]
MVSIDTTLSSSCLKAAVTIKKVQLFTTARIGKAVLLATEIDTSSFHTLPSTTKRPDNAGRAERFNIKTQNTGTEGVKH